MDEGDLKFAKILTTAITTVVCVFIISVLIYNVVDRIAPIRSVPTVTVK